MTVEELNALANLVTEKLWDKLAAAMLLRAMPTTPLQTPEPDDYVSTEQIITEFGVSKQWLYNQRKRHPQCSRLVKNNPYDQRGKRFWNRAYIKKIIHDSPAP